MDYEGLVTLLYGRVNGRSPVVSSAALNRAFLLVLIADDQSYVLAALRLLHKGDTPGFREPEHSILRYRT